MRLAHLTLVCVLHRTASAVLRIAGMTPLLSLRILMAPCRLVAPSVAARSDYV